MKRMVWFLLLVGAALFFTSCFSPDATWSPELPEKGSAKGGSSLLMDRR